MAARIIVRMELFSVIGQAYPLLKEECCRQFRDEWNRWCGRAVQVSSSTLVFWGVLWCERIGFLVRDNRVDTELERP
jgi:hypothetical protein